MLLSALSVLVVAQSSSEVPEGLMNNPVYFLLWVFGKWARTSNSIVMPIYNPQICDNDDKTHINKKISEPTYVVMQDMLKNTYQQLNYRLDANLQKVKVKFSLVQVTKAQRGRRGIVLLLL
jgi:hypothetical protein